MPTGTPTVMMTMRSRPTYDMIKVILITLAGGGEYVRSEPTGDESEQNARGRKAFFLDHAQAGTRATLRQIG